MKTCYIMRGVPGSGKTTWHRRNIGIGVGGGCEPLICSADDFFTDDETGEYKYDPKKTGEAHNWCLASFVREVMAVTERGEKNSTIIVSNTNIFFWQLRPYLAVAEAFGYEVKIIRMVCDPFTAHARNVHGVPLETVWRMHNDMENLPSQWKETPVLSFV